MSDALLHHGVRHSGIALPQLIDAVGVAAGSGCVADEDARLDEVVACGCQGAGRHAHLPSHDAVAHLDGVGPALAVHGGDEHEVEVDGGVTQL